MSAVQLVVGLGNPGAEYQGTRHNAGAEFVERLAQQQNCRLTANKKYFGLYGSFVQQGRDIRLLIPTTYMNRSGQAVAALAGFFQIAPEAILVAHDELDLPPGTARLKAGGGHGGHNGLRDIIQSLGKRHDFLRLRLGIGHPGQASEVTPFVLGRAPRGEQQRLEQAIDSALDILPAVLEGKLSAAMQTLHSKTFLS
ncbi:peptidyl-tRNA hydrolase [Ventosimonas gracilis]|uniref:Peptidyl-tRNA hydrolase n=1 Tax=Ventosimonas gracilis TaxID=1680762 RepID=A0A139SUG5_9GAMM|nr:aminoacyl-tRNA hydrolase [Ventosimonas gracilis]KXU38174.1 peptidyl-tRNA hydrolase [Ventosimonas gracilis]